MIGSTETPRSPMRNGYSLVPCSEPRYFSTRSRRVEVCSVDAVVEHDHAVRDVLLDAVAGEGPVAALAGDDRGDPALLEPAEQPTQLGAQDGAFGKAPNRHLERVDHDALGADRVDGRAEPEEQPIEVPVAGLLHLDAVDVDVVDRRAARRPRAAARSNPSDATLRDEVVGRLLEGDEHAGLVELGDAADQELHRRAASCRIRPGRTPGSRGRGAAAAGDLVEATDARRRLVHRVRPVRRHRRARLRPSRRWHGHRGASCSEPRRRARVRAGASDTGAMTNRRHAHRERCVPIVSRSVSRTRTGRTVGWRSATVTPQRGGTDAGRSDLHGPAVVAVGRDAPGAGAAPVGPDHQGAVAVARRGSCGGCRPPAAGRSRSRTTGRPRRSGSACGSCRR